jgi:hypothetical protein
MFFEIGGRPIENQPRALLSPRCRRDTSPKQRTFFIRTKSQS